MEDKKGENIILLDIQEIASFTDYFVICSGTSDRMLNSLGDAVIDDIREAFQIKGKMDGQASGGWVVVDFGDVMVHLLSPDQRSYYQLEELWERGKVLVQLQ